MTPLDIGGRLRKLRKEKHMSLSVLAEKSGVSTGLISQIERGLVAPSVVSLYHIAQALETDISFFYHHYAPLCCAEKGEPPDHYHKQRLKPA